MELILKKVAMASEPQSLFIFYLLALHEEMINKNYFFLIF